MDKQHWWLRDDSEGLTITAQPPVLLVHLLNGAVVALVSIAHVQHEVPEVMDRHPRGDGRQYPGTGTFAGYCAWGSSGSGYMAYKAVRTLQLSHPVHRR